MARDVCAAARLNHPHATRARIVHDSEREHTYGRCDADCRTRYTGHSIRPGAYHLVFDVYVCAWQGKPCRLRPKRVRRSPRPCASALLAPKLSTAHRPCGGGSAPMRPLLCALRALPTRVGRTRVQCATQSLRSRCAARCACLGRLGSKSSSEPWEALGAERSSLAGCASSHPSHSTLSASASGAERAERWAGSRAVQAMRAGAGVACIPATMHCPECG